MNQEPRYKSLRDYLRVLSDQRWVVLAVTLVAAGVALFLSLRQDPSYESTASISFQPEAAELDLIGSGTSAQNSPEQTPQARMETITEPAVVRAVAQQLDRPIGITKLQDSVTTELDTQSFLVDLTAKWGDAEFAAKLANTYSRVATKEVVADSRDDFRAQLEGVQERLDTLNLREPEAQAEASLLIDQQSRLRFLAENARPATVVAKAEVPEGASSPKTVRNTLLGTILGLVIGILAAFLRDSLDRRLHGVKDIQEELPYPLVGHVRNDVMGTVVKANGRFDPKTEDDVEAIRILRQNLEFLDVDKPPHVVLVTSALPEEGKSTVAASLAHASAALGKTTLLVESDLRRPALAQRLNLASAPGLSDYLSRQAQPRDILQTVPIAAGGQNGSGAPDGGDDHPLVCITAGTMTPRPAELLQSDRLRDFLASVAKVYEMVIIDTSPLLPVADTLELIPHVDSVLLCVRSGVTTRDQVKAARSVLEHYPKRSTGLVVTGLRRRDAAEYGYYSYGDAYRAAPARVASLDEALMASTVAARVAAEEATAAVTGTHPADAAQRDGETDQRPAAPSPEVGQAPQRYGALHGQAQAPPGPAPAPDAGHEHESGIRTAPPAPGLPANPPPSNR